MVLPLSIPTSRQGLHDITPQVAAAVAQAAAAHSDANSGLAPDRSGLCTVFIQHTSASLIIQENADPSARADLESWLNACVPDANPRAPDILRGRYTHTDEGPDDMPSHIKSALTASSIAIPILAGRLALGRWQGIYLWEHRRGHRTRSVLVHIAP